MRGVPLGFLLRLQRFAVSAECSMLIEKPGQQLSAQVRTHMPYTHHVCTHILTTPYRHTHRHTIEICVCISCMHILHTT